MCINLTEKTQTLLLAALQYFKIQFQSNRNDEFFIQYFPNHISFTVPFRYFVLVLISKPQISHLRRTYFCGNVCLLSICLIIGLRFLPGPTRWFSFFIKSALNPNSWLPYPFLFLILNFFFILLVCWVNKSSPLLDISYVKLPVWVSVILVCSRLPGAGQGEKWE